MVAKTSRSMSRPPGTSHSGLRPLRYALPIQLRSHRQRQHRDRKEKQGRALMSPLGLARVLKDRYERRKIRKGTGNPRTGDTEKRRTDEDEEKIMVTTGASAAHSLATPPQQRSAHPTHRRLRRLALPTRPSSQSRRSGCWLPPQPHSCF